MVGLYPHIDRVTSVDQNTGEEATSNFHGQSSHPAACRFAEYRRRCGQMSNSRSSRDPMLDGLPRPMLPASRPEAIADLVVQYATWRCNGNSVQYVERGARWG
jgi:hypothetical protein